MRKIRSNDIWFDIINYILVSIIALIMIYPFWNSFIYSLSDPKTVIGKQLYFLPNSFSIESYVKVLQQKFLHTGYKNTIFVTVVGTVINLFMTILAAYPLSKRNLKFRAPITFFIFFTMLFGGGLIPTYIIVQRTGLIDSLWSLIVPNAMSAYNMFLMRNFFMSIPEEMEESAKIDGARQLKILAYIILPISMPILATLALFYAVSHWNEFFKCIIYINDTRKWVIQAVLRRIIVQKQDYFDDLDSIKGAIDISNPAYRNAIIMVAVIPIVLVYPYLQKYFVKGVMVGSIKG